MSWNLSPRHRLRPRARCQSVRRIFRLTLEHLEPRLAPSVDVLTWRGAIPGNNFGVNANETRLTLANVNLRTFGQLFNDPVDGTIYGEPLVKTGVNVSGVLHDVVFVATEHDSVYAFDANTAGPSLWHDSFINPAAGINVVPNGDTGSGDIAPEIGISNTMFIDASTGTLYTTSKTKNTDPKNPSAPAHYVMQLHALNIATGAEKFGGPVTIGDTTIGGPDGGYTDITNVSIPGRGDGSNGTVVKFNALRENERDGLFEDPKTGLLYLTFTSHGDVAPTHGWMLGYNPLTLQLKTIFNTAPNGFDTAIWMGEGMPAMDADGIIYAATGNGLFDVFSSPAPGPTALGPGGGGLGYGPDSPPGSNTGGIHNSMAVKFDIFNNAGEGTNSTGVFFNGDSPTVGVNPGDQSIDLTSSGIDLHSTHNFGVTLTYDNTAHTLTERIADLDGTATFTQTYTSVNLTSQLAGNTGFVGFTGGTGGLNSTQDVKTWTVTNGSGTVIDFSSGFSNHTGLTNNGSAQFVGSLARLTSSQNGQAGSIFDNTPVDVTGGFTVHFTFQITNPGADGMTFTIQNAPATAPGPDYAESVLKIDPTQTSANGDMKVVSFFTPSDQQALSNADLDQGSGGVLLLPDSVGSTAHKHLMVQTGKEGEVYLIDRDNLGGYNTNPNGPDNVVQVLPPGTVAGGSFDTPAYFNGKIYYMGTTDVLKAFSISDGMIDPTPVAQTFMPFGFTGASPFITTDPSGNNGIVWVLDNHLHGTNGAPNGPSVLHAYDANTLTELYNSSQFGTADQLGGAVKFSVPTVANGKAYVPTQTGLYVFGLLATPRTQPPVLQVAACSSEADLKWTATANDHYDILESTDGSHFTTIASVKSSVTSFSVTNLSPNKYFFQVEAFDANSTPGFSNIVHAFVGVPTIIDETPNFADHSDLTTNGSARFFNSGPPFGTVALLTDGGFGEAGSMFSNGKLDIRRFTTTFTFAFVGGTNPIADGMTFVIQGNNSTALGGGGGGLGYSGIPKSVAVTFRAFTSSQIGLGVNGSFQSQVPITGIDFNAAAHAANVEPFQVTIQFDGTTLNATIKDLITNVSFTAPSQTVNIPSLVGGDSAYVGFSAGTGGLATSTAVGSWTYTPTTGTLPPLAPSNLAVVNVATHDANRDDVDLSWVCRSYNETGFVVQRSTDGITFTTIATLPPNSTSYTDLKLHPGTYFYRVYAFNGNGNSLFSNVDSVLLGAPRETTTVDHSGGFASNGDLTANGSATFFTPNASPIGRFAGHQDIGTPGDPSPAGNATFDSSTGAYTLTASGSDIWTNSDHMQYVYEPLVGDGSIVARLVNASAPDFWTKAGVMIRDDLTAGAANDFMLDTPNPAHQEPVMQFRDSDFGQTSDTGNHIGPTNPTPIWLKLVRSGNTFTGYWAPDTTGTLPPDAAFHLMATHTTPVMPTTVYVGLALTSHSPGNLATATFDHVMITGTTAPLPATVARLTDGNFGEAGSVFTTSRVLVSNFDTTFTFQMHGGTSPSADGMAFVLQGSTPSALGGAGGGLGYGSDHPGGPQGIPNSIAIKFDLFQNVSEGTNSTGIFFNGDSPTVPSQLGEASIDLTSSGIDLHSQDVFQVRLTYDGTTLTETITDETLASHPTFTHSYTVDIPSFIGGNVGYAGFTAGTGGLTTVADVQTWTYSFVEPKPGGPRVAAGRPTGGTAPRLTSAELTPVAQEAVAPQAASGLSTAQVRQLNAMQYQIGALGGAVPGSPAAEPPAVSPVPSALRTPAAFSGVQGPPARETEWLRTAVLTGADHANDGRDAFFAQLGDREGLLDPLGA
jgi:hypothetical protein